MGRTGLNNVLRCAVAISVLVALPLIFRSDYWMNILILSGVYVILGQGLNLMVGVNGQFVVCVAADN